MMEYKVRLTEADVADFVAAAENCACDVDIFYNHIVIDAKSILGVMSLDLSRPLTVRIAERDERFELLIRRYLVA